MSDENKKPSDRGDDDYDVGYCRPPKHTRFKPGQSGNPKGRRKGSKNLKTALEREMKRKIDVREGGKIKRISKLEALPARLFERALSGDMRAASMVVDLILRLFPPDQLERRSAPLQADDRKVIEDYFAMLGSIGPGQEPRDQGGED